MPFALHRGAQETGRSDLYLPGPAGGLRPMPGPQPRQRAGLHIAFSGAAALCSTQFPGCCWGCAAVPRPPAAPPAGRPPGPPQKSGPAPDGGAVPAAAPPGPAGGQLPAGGRRRAFRHRTPMYRSQARREDVPRPRRNPPPRRWHTARAAPQPGLPRPAAPPAPARAPAAAAHRRAAPPRCSCTRRWSAPHGRAAWPAGPRGRCGRGHIP